MTIPHNDKTEVTYKTIDVWKLSAKAEEPDLEQSVQKKKKIYSVEISPLILMQL